jgi:hypothetical protein
MSVFSKAREWDLDLDRYLNRILPPSPLHRLPAPISRFLGYRKAQRQDVGNVLGASWSMLGAFCGLVVVAAVFNSMSSIQRHHPPALIASFVRSGVPFSVGRLTDQDRVHLQFWSTMPSGHHLVNHATLCLDILSRRSSVLVFPSSFSTTQSTSQSNGSQAR